MRCRCSNLDVQQDANAMKKILLFLHPSSLLTDEVVAA